MKIGHSLTQGNELIGNAHDTDRLGEELELEPIEGQILYFADMIKAGIWFFPRCFVVVSFD
jgi:hypothetical protein